MRVTEQHLGDGTIWSAIDGSGSGYPIAEVNNCSRVVKYVVTVGQRSNSYSLVDMRIHDINVVADLSRHDPTAPDPEEPVPCDGTDIGLSEGTDDSQLPSFDYLVGQLQVWWTGLWPRLHVRFSKTAIAGPSLVLHLSAGLLAPLDFLVEEASFSLGTAQGMTLGMTQGTTQDPMDDPVFQQQMDNYIVTQILATWQTKVFLWVEGFITGILCQACLANPSLHTAAMVAIGIYIVAFLVDLVLGIAKALEGSYDAIERFYIIFGMGLFALFGFCVFSLVLPGAWYMLRHHTGITGWWNGRSGESIQFIWVKAGLTLLVFAAALAVAGMTWWGWL